MLDKWFQLYMWRDRKASEVLLNRAAHAGYRTLVLTVDVPVAGARLRDRRSGLTLPPSLNLRSFCGIVRKPSWWINVLSREPLQFASFEGGAEQFMELTNRMFDPSVTFRDFAWLRAKWEGKIVVKGILSPEDARSLVDLGADAVVVSNHGGRQLDYAVAPLDVLPAVCSEVGSDAEVFLDGGVRSGADIAAAILSGARAVMVGRPYLYGLMAGGELGVERVLDLFQEGFSRTLALLGAASVADLTPAMLQTNETAPNRSGVPAAVSDS